MVAGAGSAGLASALGASAVVGAVAGSAVGGSNVSYLVVMETAGSCSNLLAGAAAGASVLVGSVAGAVAVLVGAAVVAPSCVGFFLEEKTLFSLARRLSRASSAGTGESCQL